MNPVELIREYCEPCRTDRDTEVSQYSVPPSSGFAMTMGYTEERFARCLHCGRSGWSCWRPGQFAEASRSATYTAA